MLQPPSSTAPLVVVPGSCSDLWTIVAERDSAGVFTEGAFVVELDRFSGPLDLLLHLIREQDIDIFDIPIAQITEQFLLVVERVDELGLDRAGEFLEMAATLIRI